MPQLPPNTPFKGKREGITERGDRLAGKVRSEDPSETPSIDALEQWHPDHLDGAKRRLCAAHGILNRRSNNQSYIMQLRERCRMRIRDVGNADSLRITVRR